MASAVIACLALHITSAHAQGTFTASTVQPAMDEKDQGYFNANSPSTATGLDKWFSEASTAGQTKGQTFTLTEDVLLNSITYRLGATQATPTKVYVVRVGAIDTATNTFYELHSEEMTQTVDWGVGNNDSYGTWTLETPLTLPGLPAGAIYGVDVAMKSSTSAWQTGIPYPLFENSNVFTGGYKYTRPQSGGVLGSATNVMQNDSTRDREFHLDMTATTVSDTTAPNLTAIDDQSTGGPIYEDQVQIAYILNFDEAIDASTIDLADFENLGTGVSLDSIVSVTSLTPFPTAASIKVVFGISGTGTLQLGVKSTTDISDNYSNSLVSPVSDDTTITVTAGSTPNNGIRYWDGSITSGATDGVSQGGTGTWNTTNTNWDRGFGFATPVAWSNANLDTAVLGGGNGTITLGEGITAGGIISSATTTVSGANTLTFDVTSGTPALNVTANTLTISSQIAGSDGLQKDGAGTLILTGTNDITGGLTLNAGTLTVNNSSSAFGTGTLTVSGGQIRANANGQVSTTTNNHIWNGNFSLSRGTTGTATWNFEGDVSLGANITVSHADNTVTTNLKGIISDGGSNRTLTLAGNSGSFTLEGANTHGGGTTLNSGTLKIKNASALGSGTFTIAGGSIDNTTGSALTLSGDIVQNWNNTLTFVGTNDLNMGTGAVTMNNNRTVTITANALTVGGGIGQSGGNRSLTKSGAGTLVLSGANTYVGNTAVNVGTLELAGGSQNSAITVANAAFLGFTLGSPTISSKALTLSAGSKIKITGSPVAASYTLITAASITGTPVIDVDIPGYELVVLNSNELRLAQIGSDVTPPTLTGIVDDKSGGPVTAGSLVTYTVTFDEDMDGSTVAAADFGNTGTATVTIGSINETSPGVFTVQATPTSAGTLQLQINQGAILKDVTGNNVVTSTALSDDTVITVDEAPPSGGYGDWSGGAVFNEDTNGDGVDNGLAFLLGAPDVNANAIGLLPVVTQSGGGLVLTFTCRDDASRGSAALYVEHSNDLGITDPWQASVAVDDDGNVLANGVTLSVTVNPGDAALNDVTATISSSEAASGKLFGRLRAGNP